MNSGEVADGKALNEGPAAVGVSSEDDTSRRPTVSDRGLIGR